MEGWGEGVYFGWLGQLQSAWMGFNGSLVTRWKYLFLYEQRRRMQSMDDMWMHCHRSIMTILFVIAKK
jgi:hypothetical protein